MDELIKNMLSFNTWGVAGSTHNHDKFAYKIYKNLKASDYNVFSIDPSGKDVDGDISYKTLHDLPEKPDVISMVINPIKGNQIISEAIDLRIKYIWFQPGAENEELIDMAEKAGIRVVHNRCVLVELE